MLNDKKERGMEMQEKGYIYILTNPSFKEWVKIGYADNVEERVRVMNSHETTPFAFRIYATYEVSERLQDKSVHSLIDLINPTLRSREVIEGKSRVREFYAISPEEAYAILEKIAKINGLEKNLKLYKPTNQQVKDEESSEKVRTLSANRHHFKEIDFTSSLTGKKYHGTTADDGALKIIDLSNNQEVPNNSKPSKKAIIGAAIKDLGEKVSEEETTYQRYHRLTKLILK